MPLFAAVALTRKETSACFAELPLRFYSPERPAALLQRTNRTHKKWSCCPNHNSEQTTTNLGRSSRHPLQHFFCKCSTVTGERYRIRHFYPILFHNGLALAWWNSMPGGAGGCLLGAALAHVCPRPGWSRARRAQISVAPAHRRGTLEDPRDALGAWPQAPDAGRCASRGIRFVARLCSCESLSCYYRQQCVIPFPLVRPLHARSVVRSHGEIQGRRGGMRKRDTAFELEGVCAFLLIFRLFLFGRSRRRKSGVSKGVRSADEPIQSNPRAPGKKVTAVSLTLGIGLVVV